MRVQDMKDRWDDIKENIKMRWDRIREEDLDKFLSKGSHKPAPHPEEKTGHHADESSGSE